MKFYTKQWYDLMQKTYDYTQEFECIEDKEYSDKEIEKIYNKELVKYIKEQKEWYNTQPTNWLEEMGDGWDLDAIVKINEETDEVIYPKSREEAISWANEEYQEVLEKFNNRPEFNEEEEKEQFKEQFKENFESFIEMAEVDYPKFIFEEVDKRLLALRLMPENTYKKLSEYVNKHKKEFDKIEDEAYKVLKNQNIDTKILDKFIRLHDGLIKKLYKKDNDIYMTVEKDETGNENVDFKFTNAKFIENEAEDLLENEEDYCVWLYDELYKNNEKYELHIMVGGSTMNDLRYITIECEDIK